MPIRLICEKENENDPASCDITTKQHSDCSIPVAAESGGDFYKANSFNVGGGGRSKANTSGAPTAQAYSSCPGSSATSATSAVASGTGATAATTLDEHVSRANSRRLVGRPLIIDTETKPKPKKNPTNQPKPPKKSQLTNTGEPSSPSRATNLAQIRC